ncbi:MAG TPA: hypothetical protein VD947_03845 [Patescibacteria group bacterium]|nr:hypothetical protein [Patescibacteria group bacterium]
MSKDTRHHSPIMQRSLASGAVRAVELKELAKGSWQAEVYKKGWNFYEGQNPVSAVAEVGSMAVEQSIAATGDEPTEITEGEVINITRAA